MTSEHAADRGHPHFFFLKKDLSCSPAEGREDVFFLRQTFLRQTFFLLLFFQDRGMPKGSTNQRKENCSSNLKDECDLATNFSRPLLMQSESPDVDVEAGAFQGKQMTFPAYCVLFFFCHWEGCGSFPSRASQPHKHL